MKPPPPFARFALAVTTLAGLALLTACRSGIIGRWSGADRAPFEVSVETTLPTYQTNRATLAVDGDRETYFRSRRAPDEKDDFTLRFSRPLNLNRVSVETGAPGGRFRLTDAVVEISADGREFHAVAAFAAGGAGTNFTRQAVRAVRIHPTKRQAGPVAIREIFFAPAPQPSRVAQTLRIGVDTSEVPELADWGKRAQQLCLEWYPQLVALLPSENFEPPLATRLLFLKDMRGVADTSVNGIRIGAPYLKGHTNDWGMVIHELTHVVQAYSGTKQGYQRPPGWLVEGIADDIRLFHFEPDTPRPRINPDRAKYTDAYKTTAGFLDWIERHYDHELVKKLNAACREGVFEEGLWAKYTGKTVDALWKEFTDELRKK